MFGYYIDLAIRSLKRNVALTVLMIVAIAFGVGASMTTMTVLHVLSADPIPGQSHQLFYVQLEHRRQPSTSRATSCRSDDWRNAGKHCALCLDPQR